LWRNWWNEDWQGKPKYSEKTCPSATLSTINPTCLDPILNPGRRGGKPETNRLSYSTKFPDARDFICPDEQCYHKDDTTSYIELDLNYFAEELKRNASSTPNFTSLHNLQCLNN
jgi:hypothetical protein